MANVVNVFQKILLKKQRLGIVVIQNIVEDHRIMVDLQYMYIRDMTVDNRWVVLFNPTLVGHMNTNVEWCMSVDAVKYLCKYINKGNDQAAFKVTNRSHL